MGKRAQKAAPRPLDVPQDARLTVAMADYGQVPTVFAMCLAQAMKFLPVPARLDHETSCYVHRNRNLLLDRAMHSEATHLLFLDTDVIFPVTGIPQLLAARKPIIGGAYNLKAPPREKDGQLVTTTTVKALPEDYPDGAHDNWIMDKTRPFECAGLPTGFMLIDLRVLREIEPPPYQGANAVDKRPGPRAWFDFENRDGLFVGEDIYFCNYVRSQGVPLWCDPTIKLGHVGPNVF